MKNNLRTNGAFAVMIFLSMLVIGACSSGAAPPPIVGNTGGDRDVGTDAGDPREPQFYGVGQLLPESLAYGDLVDVAVNENYIYVLDETTVFAFTKTGELINTAAVPDNQPAKGMTIIPPNVDPPDPTGNPFPFGNHVAVSHAPGPGGLAGSVIRIYGPTLDTLMNVEDETEINPIKYWDLPSYYLEADQGQPAELTVPTFPFIPADPEPIWEFFAIMDVVANRDGALLLKATIGFAGSSPPPSSNQVVLFHPDVGSMKYHMYFPPGNDVVVPEDPPGDLVEGDSITAPWLAGQTGVGTKMALSAQHPIHREDTINFYSPDTIITRDFVGVGQLMYDDAIAPVHYELSPIAGNIFGWNRIIGESFGSAPGSFAINPAINPIDGSLEDPDLSQGGPAGVGVDPRNDNVLICDPGNRRVQVFDKFGNFIRQIGDGIRGTTGNSLVAPSSVVIDLEGTVYIADVNQLRIFRETEQELLFGTLAGTVRNRLPDGTFIPLPDSTVTVSGSAGLVTTVITDINGQYRVENLLSGEYDVVANKQLFSSDSASLKIIPDETVIANFNLVRATPPLPGHITGDVIDDVTNLALQGVQVSVLETSLSTTTDVIGAFTINFVEAGEWQVRFDLAGYNTEVIQVSVEKAGTADMGTVKLTPLLAGSGGLG